MSMTLEAGIGSDSEELLLSEVGRTRSGASKWRLGVGAFLGLALCGGMVVFAKKSSSAVTASHFFIGLNDGNDFQHLSQECQDDLSVMEQEYKDSGKEHEATTSSDDNETVSDHACDEGHMRCTFSVTVGDVTHEGAKCFPSKSCKPENIEAELKHGMEDTPMEFSCEVKDGNTIEANAEANSSDGDLINGTETVKDLMAEVNADQNLIDGDFGNNNNTETVKELAAETSAAVTEE